MDKSIFTARQAELQRLLREIRAAAGLRQSDLAALLGQPQPFISKYERGSRRLDLIEIHQICEACGVTLTAFIRRYMEAIGDC